MTIKIIPLQDRVVVRRSEEEDKTAGGIILAAASKEKPSKGEVIAVGKGKKSEDGSLQAMDVKVGDTVLFGQYAGNAVKLDGEEVLIMNESDIFGILA